MVALLFATKVIEGKWPYERVPDLWIDEVDAILKAEDREDLIKRR